MEITAVDVAFTSVRRNYGTISALKEVDESVFEFVRVSADDGSAGIGETPDVEHPKTPRPSDDNSRVRVVPAQRRPT